MSSLINSKNSDDSDTNGYFNNGDVSFGNSFMNSHSISQCNKSSSFNDMDGDVEDGDVSGGFFKLSVTPYIKKRNTVT